MNVGIVGAGFIGRAVAHLALDVGHGAMVGNLRGLETLCNSASGIGVVDARPLSEAWRFKLAKPAYFPSPERRGARTRLVAQVREP